MIRALLILILVLAVWCGVASWAVFHQRGKIATVQAELTASQRALRSSLAARKRLDAALVSNARKNAATEAAGRSAQASLASAAASAPEWASQAVPEGVRDALK